MCPFTRGLVASTKLLYLRDALVVAVTRASLQIYSRENHLLVVQLTRMLSVDRTFLEVVRHASLIAETFQHAVHPGRDAVCRDHVVFQHVV